MGLYAIIPPLSPPPSPLQPKALVVEISTNVVGRGGAPTTTTTTTTATATATATVTATSTATAVAVAVAVAVSNTRPYLFLSPVCLGNLGRVWYILRKLISNALHHMFAIFSPRTTLRHLWRSLLAHNSSSNSCQIPVGQKCWLFAQSWNCCFALIAMN